MMNNGIAVNIVRVQLEKKGYHLVFEGYIPAFDKSRKYTFDFCGTEIDTNACLIDEAKENLRLNLQKDFGMPPYVLSEAKKVLGKEKQYFV